VAGIGDRLGCFVPGGAVRVAGAPSGPLSGLAFAAKDLFDVAGTVTGGGNPAFAAARAPAAAHAAAVARLLDAGATLVGKTITDELAWSLMGENAHYGTPVNAAAPDRIPGGSSSGSASAVAGGAADTALGSDTGGSVRIPASFCGLWGLRPTHGAIPLDGVLPLAPTFDTVGWFARDAATFARVGAVLLGPAEDAPPPAVRIAEDAFALCDPAVAAALRPLADRLAEALGGRRESASLLPEGDGPWRDAFRVLQSREAWAAHGAWISSTDPRFGPGVADRFAAAARIGVAEEKAAAEVRAGAAAHVRGLTADGALVLLPTAPCAAPPRGAPAAATETARIRILALTCPAGLAGAPQLTIPAATADGGPVGLSILAAPGADRRLLALAGRAAAALGIA
jgi:amidase